MSIHYYDYVDPDRVLQNTAEFLARPPQKRSLKVTSNNGGFPFKVVREK
jgi:hypothetical protein